jgi:RNA polymerase sigma-70 factor (ECF subfamily)
MIPLSQTTKKSLRRRPPEKHDAILNRLKSDDKSVLKDIFQQHYSPVCAAMYRYILDRNLVEDLAQNVFIRLWEKRQTINITSSLGAYLRRMAINEALGHLRKYKNVHIEEITPITPVKQTENTEEQYLHKELQEQITDAINTLPPKCRRVFQLSRFEDLTYREIATKLDVSVKTVENQMGKALRVLRERMKRYL